MAQHLFLDLAAVVRQHAANVQKVGAKIESLVQGYSKTGPNVRQLKVWLGKLRKAYAAGLIDPPSRGRPRENEFVTVAVQQAYSVKDLEGEANYLVKVLSRAQDRDSWQAAFDVTDMHVRGARVSLERIATRLEEAAQDLMPERFRFGKFTVVDRYGLSQRRVQPWFEAITRASRLLEQKGVGYLLYGDLVLTSSNDWGGLYNPTGDIVSLDLAGGSVGTKRLTEVLVHELGHRLWFKFLDGGARDRFASPWISRDEATRRVWEQYRDVFTMPPDEPREAFELVWKTKYDFKAFQQWIRESPAKLARWMRFANNLYTGPEPAHTVIRNNKLNREAFDHARQKVERWSEQSDDIDVREGNAQSLERFRARQERVWREVKSYRSSMLSYQEVEDMLEPHGSEFHVNPRAKKGGVLRKLLEIKPVDFSVTRYGNMNRREDFAEIFTEVLMGRVKDRAVQQRLQAVLPQGRVLSVTAATMTREAAFKLFKEAVVDLWSNGHKVLDRMQLSSSKPKSKVYAALVLYPNKVKAIGNTIAYASPTYELQIADRLLEESPGLIRDIMRHEALHVGYPRHDSNFRRMAAKNRIPQTEEQTTDPGFKVQRKEGSRYRTVKTFDEYEDAMRWGKQQAMEDREHRYRVAGAPCKNPDPKAQAFWRFVDRAAAQVDGWPDWMLHREPPAANVTADVAAMNDTVRQIEQALPPIENAYKRVKELMFAWRSTGEMNSRQIKLALTAHMKQVARLAELKPPANLRPGEREEIEKHLMRLRSYVKTAEDKTKKLKRDLAKMDAKTAQWFLKTAISDIAWGVRHDIQELVKDAQQFIEPESKYGPFTLIDRHGIKQYRTRYWFEAITRASRILKQKGFAYLLYGRLVLTPSDKWSGLYQSYGDIVSLSTGESARPNIDSMIKTLIHELGHRLWYKFLDTGARDRFATPWIDQQKVAHEVYERVRPMLKFPSGEPEEAWRTVWESDFSFRDFGRWVQRGDKARPLRWLLALERVHAYTITETAYFAKDGVFNQKAFDISRERVQRLRKSMEDRGIDKDQVAKRMARDADWIRDMWLKPDAKLQVTEHDVRTYLERGPTGTSAPSPIEPYAEQMLDIVKIKPSVTDYGQTNRMEDFAEVFAMTILGKNKDRAVQRRLQAVLPAGRVLSSADVIPVGLEVRALADAGHTDLASDLAGLT